MLKISWTRIYFFNINTLKLKNTSYIANIHKTHLYSGSELVKFCLEINRILGVKKTLIRDMADIKCNAKWLRHEFIIY
jgi:hypothetical protein